jgi:hypothetical protein
VQPASGLKMKLNLKRYGNYNWQKSWVISARTDQCFTITKCLDSDNDVMAAELEFVGADKYSRMGGYRDNYVQSGLVRDSTSDFALE